MTPTLQVFSVNTTAPTGINTTFTIGVPCHCVTSEQLRSERDREAEAIRRDKTISRKERRKQLSLLQKRK